MEYPRREDPAVEASTLDHHELREKDLLQLRDLGSALTLIRNVDALYRQNRVVSDWADTSIVREFIVRSEHRTQAMAASVGLRRKKRSEKREIARGFKVWLEVPDLFFDWLEMRQESGEFPRMFPHFNGRSWHHAGKRSFSI